MSLHFKSDPTLTPSRDGVFRLADFGQYAGTSVSNLWLATLVRENAYKMNAERMSKDLDSTKSYAKYPRFVTLSLQHIDQMCQTKNVTSFSPYELALATDSLIQYYETEPDPLKRDPRIRPAIQVATECLWGMWDSATLTFVNPSQTSAQTMAVGDPSWNLVIAPLFLWAFENMTGDQLLPPQNLTNAERAGQIFLGGVQGTVFSNSDGFTFHRNYAHSVDFVIKHK
jgi:hypothetical protein